MAGKPVEGMLVRTLSKRSDPRKKERRMRKRSDEIVGKTRLINEKSEI